MSATCSPAGGSFAPAGRNWRRSWSERGTIPSRRGRGTRPTPTAGPCRKPMFDPKVVRKDFPIFERRVHGDKPLVYLDSANTSQKPRRVLDALTDFYEHHNANIHRAVYQLA